MFSKHNKEQPSNYHEGIYCYDVTYLMLQWVTGLVNNNVARRPATENCLPTKELCEHWNTTILILDHSKYAIAYPKN
jgi:hypothetical protein